MSLVFADQMRAVEFPLVAMMLQNHQRHGNHHEAAESEHRGGNGQVQFDEQRIDAQHGENGEILIKVLHGNGTARAHQDMAAML